jgi:hypothetical protein
MLALAYRKVRCLCACSGREREQARLLGAARDTRMLFSIARHGAHPRRAFRTIGHLGK